MYIPLIALSSGGSFGFFMGIGMLMRSEMEGKQEEGSQRRKNGLDIEQELNYFKIDPISGRMSRIPMYRGYKNI